MEAIHHFKKGESMTIQKRVTEDDTTLLYGSGSIEKLLSTPSLVALMQEASYRLLDRELPEGIITVSKEASVRHSKPTPLGSVVSIKVTIQDVATDELTLRMEAFDESGMIGTGTHTRAFVSHQNLLNRASSRVVT